MHPLEKYRIDHRLTQRELAEKIGMDYGNLNRIIKGKAGISAVIKDRIEKAIGLKVMEVQITKGKPPLYKVENDNFFPDLIKGNEMFPVKSPAFNEGSIDDSPFIDLGNGQYNMLIPLVEQTAQAGFVNGWSDAEYISELPKHSIIVDRFHRGRYYAFRVVGDSMEDGTIGSIPERSIVTGREIKQDLWRSKFHITKFKYYVIVHQDGIMVKQIIDHDTEIGKITCHSLNPVYHDFDLNLDDIKMILNIVNISIPS